MRILITGINGVLGSTLAQELRHKGHDVWGCDLTHSDDPQIIRADVSERRQIANAFERSQPDLVYNMAGEFGRVNGRDFYEQLWKTNCIGTQNVIAECVRAGAVLAHASSSEAYGLAEQYTNGALHEELLDEHPPQFHNIYALSKYTNERQVTMAVRNEGLRAIIFRFFNVYGPPERYSPYRSVVCQLAYRLLKRLPVTVTKDGWRSHLWIGDFARTVGNLPERLDRLFEYENWPGAGGAQRTPVFNIGGDEYSSIEAVSELLIKIINPSYTQIKYVDSEPANCATKRPNNQLSKDWLDYRETVSLWEGLHRTVEFLRETYGL